MTPRENMILCIKRGDVKDEWEWCTKVLESTNPKSSSAKPFALSTKVALMQDRPKSVWWELLRDKEQAGHRLGHFQAWAWRQAEKRNDRVP